MINVDEKIENADWPKRRPDFDAFGTVVESEVTKAKASAPWWERELAFNPYHVQSGEHGGEFTSAEGLGALGDIEEQFEYEKELQRRREDSERIKKWEEAQRAEVAATLAAGGAPSGYKRLPEAEAGVPVLVGRGIDAKKIPARYIDGIREAVGTVPADHLIDLASIKIVTDRRMTDRAGAASGLYIQKEREVWLNRKYFDYALVHEIGHHVHLNLMTEEGRKEWDAISLNGKTAKVSKYAQTKKQTLGREHFAEFYDNYARARRPKPSPLLALTGKTPGESEPNRQRLQQLYDLEPQSYRFMERVFDPTSGLLRKPA